MTASPLPERLRFGDCELQPAARVLLVGEQPAKLGARALDVLVALVERRDRVVAKHELLDIVWPGVVVEENNLQVHVSALRKLLGAQAIATIPGRGYRFTAALDDAPATAGHASPTPGHGAPTATPAHAAPTTTPGHAAPATGAPAATGGPRAMPVAGAGAPATGTLAPGNLPLQPPPLIGRAAELDTLVQALQAERLVSLVGAAGVGKTALALAAAHALRPHWRDGAWRVDLAPVVDATQLAPAVAQALGVALAGAGAAEDRLLEVLPSRALLLVLDNCEHLADATAALAERLQARAPGVRLLATSQGALGVAGERVVKLDALAVPDAEQVDTDAARFGAVALFVARVQAADPRFELDARNADVVADICRQLDGLPLAIELAAARVRLLGVQGVRDRLGERFRMLTGGNRTALPRHQTLRASFDWSHALLAADEQAVFRRLGPCVGGFTLETAQQLAADETLDEWAVLDALSSLVDRSLVAVDAAEPPRYRLLQTARAYALERLADAGETARLLARHARVVEDLFTRTEQARYGESGALTMAEQMHRLAPEVDNARAALRWAGGPDGDLRLAVALAAAAAAVFKHLGLVREALAWTQPLHERLCRAADAPDGGADADAVPAETRAVFWDALVYLGGNARLPKQTMLDAVRRAEQAHREGGSPRRLYRSLCGQVWALTQYGQLDAAEALLPEIEALAQPGWPGWLRSVALGARAVLRGQQGRPEEALALLGEQRALLERQPGEDLLLRVCVAQQALALTELGRYEEAIAHAEPLIGQGSAEGRADSHLIGHLVTSLALLGRIDDAREALRRAIPVWQRDGQLFNWGYVIALVLAQSGRDADAARVLGLEQALRRTRGAAEAPMWRRLREHTERTLAQVAGTDLARWQAEGEGLDEGALAALVLDELDPRTAAPVNGAAAPAP